MLAAPPSSAHAALREPTHQRHSSRRAGCVAPLGAAQRGSGKGPAHHRDRAAARRPGPVVPASRHTGAATRVPRRKGFVGPRAVAPGPPQEKEEESEPDVPPDVQCVQVGMDSMECFLPEEEQRSSLTLVEAEVSTSESSDSLLQNLFGVGLLVIPFALWGTAMVSTKLVLPHTSPLFVAVSRLLPAGLILCGVAASRGAPLPRSAAAWGAVALFGIVDGTLFQGFMASGLQSTSTGLASIIIDTQPLTVAVLAALFLDEPITTTTATGLAVGVLGLSVGLLPPEAFASGDLLHGLLSVTSGSGWGSGETMLMLAAQSMAVGTVLARWVCKDMGVEPTMATGLHLTLGSLPLLAASAASEPELYSRIAEQGLPLADAGLLAYTSIFGGAVAYGIFFHAASKGSLVRLSSLTFMTPLFATVAGFLALGETLTPSQCAGGLVALAGVTLVVMGKAAPGSGKGKATTGTGGAGGD